MAPLDLSRLTVTDYYDYLPSTALCCVALAMFAAAGLASLVVTEWRRPPRRAGHLVTLTALCEAGGYAAMLFCILRSGTTSLFGAYAAQQLLALLSPNLVQASMYSTLGVVLSSPAAAGVARGRRWLRGGVVSCTFVLADVFALM